MKNVIAIMLLVLFTVFAFTLDCNLMEQFATALFFWISAGIGYLIGGRE